MSLRIQRPDSRLSLTHVGGGVEGEVEGGKRWKWEMTTCTLDTV